MIIKNANYSAEKDADLNIISAAINFTNVDERTGSQVYGRIAITNEQAKQLEAKEIMPADVIEPMLIDILGLGIDEDDVARFVALENELKTQITEKDAEIARLNDALMEMVLMISNLTMPDIDIPEPEEPQPEEPQPEEPEEPQPEEPQPEEPEEPEEPVEPPTEEPVEEVEEDGEIITDDSDMDIDPIDTNTTEGGEGGE